MSRTCSQCGNNGHNSRTCTEASGGGSGAAASVENGIMLFGVRVTEGNAFRKSASMTNLSQYEQPLQADSNDVVSGYASDDVVHASGHRRERKRGVAWTEEEHMLFLQGLQKVGKGDWRGISRNFVKTRTPTQVASHAQKYFLRRNNHNRRRRRSSLFDITADTPLMNSLMEEDLGLNNETVLPYPPHPQSQSNLGCKILGGFPVSSFPMSIAPAVLPVTGESSSTVETLKSQGASLKTLNEVTNKLIRPIPLHPVPPSSKMAGLNLNNKYSAPPATHEVVPLPLSLKLSTTTTSSEEQSPTTSHSSAFQAMSSGSDSIISVA